MKILIFRHGVAEERRPDLPDDQRQLTRQGYNRTRLAAIGLTRLMRPVDAILTSPYTRAQQTAAVLGIAMSQPVETLDALAADCPARAVIDALRQREESSVALVGHNPQLEDIVALLCQHDPTRRLTSISKAGAVLLKDRRNPIKPATLTWAMQPRTLRMLARRMPRQRPPGPICDTGIERTPPCDTPSGDAAGPT